MIDQLLPNCNGGRKSENRINGRLLQAIGDDTICSHKLALALLMQRVKDQRGFARAGQTGDNHQLVSWDINGDIFEIVQASVLNANILLHSLILTNISEKDICHLLVL